MKWKIKQAQMAILDLRTITSVGVEVEVELENGSSFQCVLPMLSYPGREEEVKALMAEYIDPYDIRDYVRSSVEAMVNFRMAMDIRPEDRTDNYIHFTEGIINNIASNEEY